MATSTQFLEYWGLALVTLSLTLVLLSLFCRFIDSDLDLHGLRKEIVIAFVASAVQGAGFWFSASLFPGNPFRRLVIPSLSVGIIYYLAHLEDWSGYEVGGILYFQSALLATGALLFSGEIKIAFFVLGIFAFGLVIIAGIARSL